MGSLAAAYSVAWVAVVTYLGWLGLQSRRLTTQLEDLEKNQNAGKGNECTRRAA